MSLSTCVSIPKKTKYVNKVNKKEDVSSVGNRLAPLLRFLSDSDSFSSSKVSDCCQLFTRSWFNFLFLFLEFTTEPWLFSKNIQSQTSLSKWHSSHWLNATKEFSPWTSGIQSWDVWGALDRWLLISRSLNTLFWEDVASPRKREQEDETNRFCLSASVVDVCDDPSNCYLSPLIRCRVMGGLEPIPADMGPEKGQDWPGQHAADMMNR